MARLTCPAPLYSVVSRDFGALDVVLIIDEWGFWQSGLGTSGLEFVYDQTKSPVFKLHINPDNSRSSIFSTSTLELVFCMRPRLCQTFKGGI